MGNKIPRPIPMRVKPIYVFNYAHKNIPKQGEGEDAYYLGRHIMVMCDGVGSWKELGHDAGIYARTLVRNICRLYSNNQLFYIDNPKQLIKQAVNLTDLIGSSTVTVITLNPKSGQMRVAYLGDSIYQLYRRNFQNKAVLAGHCPQLQSVFNCPYQVGTYGHDPSKAEVIVSNLQVSDIVILASDGLWDNVYDEKIGNEVNTQSSLKCLAQTLGRMAKQNSQNKRFKSPFYKKAQQNKIQMPVGGKPDDITVLVAQVAIM